MADRQWIGTEPLPPSASFLWRRETEELTSLKLETPMSCAMMSRAIFRAAVADLSTARRMALRMPRADSSVAHFSNLLASTVTLIVDMVPYYLLVSL